MQPEWGAVLSLLSVLTFLTFIHFQKVPRLCRAETRVDLDSDSGSAMSPPSAGFLAPLSFAVPMYKVRRNNITNRWLEGCMRRGVCACYTERQEWVSLLSAFLSHRTSGATSLSRSDKAPVKRRTNWGHCPHHRDEKTKASFSPNQALVWHSTL